MKVVQINCSASGSTGNIAKAIHRQLREQGHESYIFYEAGTATEENMFRIGDYFSLHAHAVLSRNLGMQGYFSFFPTLRLLRKLKMLAPDVIHLHNLHGSYLNLPMLFGYLKKANCKVLITLHDCWLFTGKCPHFTVVGCEKWKDSCGDCPQLTRYPRSKVDTTAKCLADKKEWLSGFEDRLQIVAVSNWLCEVAGQSFLAQYPIETIYNGVDCDIFKPIDATQAKKKYGLENKSVILGVSSNWSEEKGLNDFLRLSQQLSNDDVIVLVGVTQKQKEMLPRNVIGILRTENQTELAALYCAADVFVNPSKEETFGLVTAEAMACGTPVVVYASTACAELINDKNGYVVCEAEGRGLLECIDAAKKNGHNVRTAYSIKTMTEQYVNLYCRMV